MIRPIIAEQSFGRYLNWPDLKARIDKLTGGAEERTEIDIGCRLVPSTRRLKDWGRTDQEVSWEMDKVDEINAVLEEEENGSWKTSTRLVWMQDAILPEKCEERRGR